MQLELSILTLNVWGIPYVSKDRDIRMQAIGNFLAENDNFDVVSLQEVWTEHDYQLIRKIAEKNFPFSHYFYSGVFGSGLCILSRHPIISTLFHAWSVNGYVHRIHHGDWFGGKGVGLCKLLIDGHLVHVYIAHLHAEYDRESDDYNAHRVVQAFDTAQFIQSTQCDSCVQVLAGDLNTEPGDLAYRILLVASGLQETFNETEHADNGTNECGSNSYTPANIKEKAPKGKRIDYILFRSGLNHKVKVVDYKLPLPSTVPEHTISYSDHEAVYAKLRIMSSSKTSDSFDTCNSKPVKESRSSYADTLSEGIEVLDQILKRLRSDKNIYFIMALILIIPLFFLIDILPPYGMGMLFLIAKMLFSGIVIFLIFMATMWNSIERNGILSTKLSMEMTRTTLLHYDNRPYFDDNSCS